MIGKIKLILKFMTSQQVYKQWKYIYCLVSHEVNTTWKNEKGKN